MCIIFARLAILQTDGMWANRQSGHKMHRIKYRGVDDVDKLDAQLFRRVINSLQSIELVCRVVYRC